MTPPPRRPSDLSIRSGTADLVDQASLVNWTSLLHGQAGASAWRVVEVFARQLAGTSAQFAAWLLWSAGHGSGAQARVWVTHSTRIAVFASSIEVRAARVGPGGTLPVGVTIADALYVTSQNHWSEDVAPGVGGVPSVVPLPAFARTCRFEAQTIAGLAAANVDLLDGSGVIRAQYQGNAQPAGGIPLAGAASVQVTTGVVGRVVFDLHL